MNDLYLGQLCDARRDLQRCHRVPVDEGSISRMLTIQQYQVLNSCADDWELFYFLFAAVNYGGQVFRREEGQGYGQYDDESDRPVRVSGQAVTRDLISLIRLGLLECHRVLPDGSRQGIDSEHISESDLSDYDGYSCLTFDEHIQRYGYGPHEFKITPSGRAEIALPVYNAYDRQLGWS